MGSLDWDRVRALFDEAVELPADQRATFLDRACIGDDECRRELESLLDHENRADETFLRPPEGIAANASECAAPLDPAPVVPEPSDLTPDPARLVGEMIGPYRLLRVLGKGGMSVVYLAEQERPRRLVALKVMHGGVLSRSAWRRFEYESEILGRLRHPNIAQVFEAGTFVPATAGGAKGGGHPPVDVDRFFTREIALPGQGQVGAALNGSPEANPIAPDWLIVSHSLPWFAMEYVPNALSITAYARERSLTVRARVELFLQVLEALNHGHQRGVIHRDIKPANILVAGDDGAVKLIDFGIARCGDPGFAHTTVQTDMKQLMGTLQYMSPEQFTDPSDVDLRTDVYSLGVVLYELLCGRPPHDLSRASLATAARIVCESPPPPPSQITRNAGRAVLLLKGETINPTGLAHEKVKGDLERVILKALEKPRSRRYETAAALSQDLRRWLTGEPVSARPGTIWTRAWRWSKRHSKAATVVACLAISTLVTLSTAISIWWINARPDEIELTCRGQRYDADGQAYQSGDLATVKTVGGRKLVSWTASTEVGIRLAKLVKTPALLGGNRLLILAFSRNVDTPYRGTLCAFNAEGPYDEPIWERTIQQSVIDAMPDDAWPRPHDESERNYRESGFAVGSAWMFDVFPGSNHPGEEIVVCHQHDAGSQSALRIYNLGGELLFQAWYDGIIDDAYWMKGPKLLLLTALKSDMDANQYEDSQGTPWPSTIRFNHPRVVFAIRPTLQMEPEKQQAWIYPCRPGDNPRFVGDNWKGEWYQPIWYKLPCDPKRFGEQTQIHFMDRSSDTDSRHLDLRVRFPGIERFGHQHEFNLWIDENGSIVERGEGDFPRRALDEDRQKPDAERALPDPQSFELIPWTEFAPPWPTPPNGPASGPAETSPSCARPSPLKSTRSDFQTLGTET